MPVIVASPDPINNETETFMRARFIGDPNDDFSGPAVLNFGGVSFPKDRWVRNIPEAMRAGLAAHSHFEVDRTAPEPVAEAEIPAVETVEPVSALVEPAAATPALEPTVEDAEPADETDLDAAKADPLDHDRDGRRGGDTGSAEKDALIAELEAIEGAEFDRRWGVPKLRAALEAAKFMAGED